MLLGETQQHYAYALWDVPHHNSRRVATAFKEKRPKINQNVSTTTDICMLWPSGAAKGSWMGSPRERNHMPRHGVYATNG